MFYLFCFVFFCKTQTLIDWTCRTWHFECKIRCGLFKADETNSSRKLAKTIQSFESRSFFLSLFLSVSDRLRAEKSEGDDSSVFYFLSTTSTFAREVRQLFLRILRATWRTRRKKKNKTRRRYWFALWRKTWIEKKDDDANNCIKLQKFFSFVTKKNYFLD